MSTRIEELSVRITSHPEGDPEPATVVSGWARTLEGRRHVERGDLRLAIVAAAGLAETPHVISERYTETTWEAAGASLELEIAVARDLGDGPAVERLAAIVGEIAGGPGTDLALDEDLAMDLVRWHIAVALDHSPEQVEVEELERDGDGWSVRVITHLGTFDAVLSPDGGVGFRKVSPFS